MCEGSTLLEVLSELGPLEQRGCGGAVAWWPLREEAGKGLRAWLEVTRSARPLAHADPPTYSSYSPPTHPKPK